MHSEMMLSKSLSTYCSALLSCSLGFILGEIFAYVTGFVVVVLIQPLS